MSGLDEKMGKIRFIVSDVDGVLTNNLMGFDAEGRPFRHFNARDGLGLALWYLAGGKAALLSGQSSKSVEAVGKQWRCTECLLGVRDKATACRELAQRHGLDLSELAFIGDDLLDLEAIRTAGLGIAVADAVERVKEAADYVTDTAGGAGALRETVEHILRIQGRLDHAIAQYCKNPPDA